MKLCQVNKIVKNLLSSVLPQLINIIYQLQLKVDELTEQNQKLEKALEDKRFRIDHAGNIAEAALEINDFFRSAQSAADHYLNDANNWQVTYTDMPESDAYSIEEVNVPPSFIATYQQKGYVFTVTNTSVLIQTGQLLWPIPLLAFAGVLLIAAGTVLLQEKRDHYA